MKGFYISLLVTVLTVNYSFGSFIVDRFDTGEDIHLHPPETNIGSDYDSPFGTGRGLLINSRDAVGATTMESTILSSSGTFNFAVQEMNLDSKLYTALSYYNFSGFNSLSPDQYFEFSLASVQGSGNLSVQLGRQSRPTEEDIVIPLLGPGIIRLPMTQVNVENATIDNFSAIHFYFEAESEQFSFTLNEIRVVPEPSSLLLLLGGAGILLLRRIKRSKITL